MSTRKSPTQSAIDFKVGTHRRGKDGEMWIVAQVKRKSGKKPYHQWRRVTAKNRPPTPKLKTRKERTMQLLVDALSQPSPQRTKD
jgi:hypothetical protein